MDRISKKILMGLGIMVMMFGVATQSFGSSLNEKRAKEVEQKLILQQATKSGANLISENEAKKIALETAGVNPNEVKYVKVKLDKKRGHRGGAKSFYIYEVEFLHDGLEYEFDIDATTKEVLKTDVDSWLD